jgi:hypothetical protein
MPGTSPKLIRAAEATLHKGEDQDWGEVFTYAIQRSPYESQYAMSQLGDEDDELDYLLNKARQLNSYGKLEFTTQYSEESDSTD